jgi:hypothetical protein
LKLEKVVKCILLSLGFRGSNKNPDYFTEITLPFTGKRASYYLSVLDFPLFAALF